MKLLLNFWSFLVFTDFSRYIFVNFWETFCVRGREGWRPLYFTAAASDTRRKLWKPGHHFIFPFLSLIPIHRRPNLDFNSFFGPCAFFSHARVKRMYSKIPTQWVVLMSWINKLIEKNKAISANVCSRHILDMWILGKVQRSPSRSTHTWGSLR